MTEPALEHLFTVDDLVEQWGIGRRWLLDQCRGNHVEHVYMARQRKFTADQARAVLAKFTVQPKAEPKTAARDRDLARLTRTPKRSR